MGYGIQGNAIPGEEEGDGLPEVGPVYSGEERRSELKLGAADNRGFESPGCYGLGRQETQHPVQGPLRLFAELENF